MLSAAFLIPTEINDTTFSANPTNFSSLMVLLSISSMNKADCLLDIRAGMKPVCSSMIPPSWTDHMKRQKNLQLLLHTVTQQLLLLNVLILLHLLLGKLNTPTWVRLASHLAVNILLLFSFSYRVICRLFLLECKVVPWHSQTVAILVYAKQFHTKRTASSPALDLDKTVDQKLQKKYF